jgi:hypothetical protein
VIKRSVLVHARAAWTRNVKLRSNEITRQNKMLGEYQYATTPLHRRSTSAVYRTTDGAIDAPAAVNLVMPIDTISIAR